MRLFHSISCQRCGADLTKTDSIEVHTIDADGDIDYGIFGQVDKLGELTDLSPFLTSRINDGVHYASYCMQCHERLEVVRTKSTKE